MQGLADGLTCRTCRPRSGFGLLAIAVLIGGVLADSLTPETETTLKVHVLDSKANIYVHPDPLSPVLRSVKSGDVFSAFKRSETWYEVGLAEGQTGWIEARHVVVDSSCLSKLPQRTTSSSGKVLGALAGTCLGGTAAMALVATAIVLGIEGFHFSNEVRGSGGVSRTAVGAAAFAGFTATALTPAAAAYGAYSVGERREPGGSMWMSWAGAAGGGFAGFFAGYGLGFLFSLAGAEMEGPLAALGGLVGTTAGAVIGYDRSKASAKARRSLSQRIGVPTLGITPGTQVDGQTYVGLRLNLLALQF